YSTYPSPTLLYTLSLHDALPISSLPWLLRIYPTYPRRLNDPVHAQKHRRLAKARSALLRHGNDVAEGPRDHAMQPVVNLPLFPEDRKSTRLNSSHVSISYAVFCL